MPLDFTIPCLGKINTKAASLDVQHLHDLTTHQELHKIAKSFINNICSFSIAGTLPLDLKNRTLEQLFNALKIELTQKAYQLSTDDVIELLLQLLSPDSMSIHGHIFGHLVDEMTPQSFLSDFTLSRTKKFFYHNTPDDEEYYKNPAHLTRLGLLRKFTELKNSDNIYHDLLNEYLEFIKIDYESKQAIYTLKLNELLAIKHQIKTAEDIKTIRKIEQELLLAEANYKLALETSNKKEFISIDGFLAIRRYSTNFYCKINGELRFNQQNNCSKYIELINKGLIRLCTIPLYQLNYNEHQLTRHLKLPPDALEGLIKDLNKQKIESNVAIFKDKALLSTSYNDGGAEEFAKDANLTVHIFTNGDTMLGIKLRKISVFPNENEFLYLPGVDFHVKSTKYIEESKCWHIDVQATNIEDEFRRTLNVIRFGKFWLKKTVEAKNKQIEASRPKSPEEQQETAEKIAKTLQKAQDRACNPPSFAAVLTEAQRSPTHSDSISSVDTPLYDERIINRL